MSLKYKFRTAEKTIHQLTSNERHRLEEICTEIQEAEKSLNQKALAKLNGCKNDCRGLCCRNVIPDDLITQADVLYIWMKASSMRELINSCLHNESLYTADCFFLKNGVGPCIFPLDVRPEKCLTTFCGDTSVIIREIRGVRSKLNKLSRFVLFRKFRWLIRTLPM
jgi:hypothetical protein